MEEFDVKVMIWFSGVFIGILILALSIGNSVSGITPYDANFLCSHALGTNSTYDQSACITDTQIYPLPHNSKKEKPVAEWPKKRMER